MEILIKKNKNQLYRLSIGRDLPNSKSCYFIDIVLEDYDDCCNIVYATFIKGFFPRRDK